MGTIRHLLKSRRQLALLIAGLALLMRLAIPAGFMPAASGGMLTLAICTGHGPATIEVAPIAAGSRESREAPKVPDYSPCAFSALTDGALAPGGAAFFASAIAFAFLLALLSPPPIPIRRAAYLRPPLRGPPITA